MKQLGLWMSISSSAAHGLLKRADWRYDRYLRLEKEWRNVDREYFEQRLELWNVDTLGRPLQKRTGRLA